MQSIHHKNATHWVCMLISETCWLIETNINWCASRRVYFLCLVLRHGTPNLLGVWGAQLLFRHSSPVHFRRHTTSTALADQARSITVNRERALWQRAYADDICVIDSRKILPFLLCCDWRRVRSGNQRGTWNILPEIVTQETESQRAFWQRDAMAICDV